MKPKRIVLLIVLFGLGFGLGILIHPPLMQWLIAPMNGSLIVS